MVPEVLCICLGATRPFKQAITGRFGNSGGGGVAPGSIPSLPYFFRGCKMNSRLRIDVIATLASLACAMTATGQQYSFRYYGVDQGLTDLAVRRIFQDRKGFLWLSTENGIFRYDGTGFKSYGEKNGIPTSNAAVFGEAPDGSLLAGTNSGLYRLTANQFKRVPMPGATKVSFGSGIESDGSGRSWIPTDGGLVSMTWNEGTRQWALALLPPSPHLGGSAAYGVLAEKDRVWWGCGTELCVAEGGKTRVIGQSLGLAPSFWKGLVRSGNEDLWVQSKDGNIAVMRTGKTAFEIPELPLSLSRSALGWRSRKAANGRKSTDAPVFPVRLMLPCRTAKELSGWACRATASQSG